LCILLHPHCNFPELRKLLADQDAVMVPSSYISASRLRTRSHPPSLALIHAAACLY
jgi:hypothetical protein